jgi:hypothetical protein
MMLLNKRVQQSRGADQSAVGAINRPLRNMYAYRGQALLQGFCCELLYEDGAHDAIAVNEIGCGNGSDTVCNIGFISWIEQEWIGDLKRLAKRGDVILWIGLIDAEQNEGAVQLRVGVFEKRHFAATGCAGFGPEVDDDGMAAQGTQVYRSAA